MIVFNGHIRLVFLAAKKQNHDLSARCAAEVKTLQSELLEKNEIIKKLRKDVSEQQLLLDEAGVKVVLFVIIIPAVLSLTAFRYLTTTLKLDD